MGFTPNGCSLSPDGSWRHCCDEHDLAYFVGGSLRDKLRADLALARCITRSIGSAEALWTRRLKGVTRFRRTTGVGLSSPERSPSIES